MATYYVRLDGNDSNSGLGPAANQAWATIEKALGVTGIGSGDTLYIAPGNYRIVSTITIAGTYSSVTQIIGDTTCSQFTGLVPGRILISTRATSDIGNPAGTFNMFTATSKSFLRWSYLAFEQTSNANIFTLVNCTEFRWTGCYFQYHSTNALISNTDNSTNGLTKNYVFSKCIFTGWGSGGVYIDSTLGKSSPATSNYVYGLTFELCVQIGLAPISLSSYGTYTGTSINVYNCTGITLNGTNLNTVRIRNCISPSFASSGNNVDFLIENCSTGSIGAGAGTTVTNCVSNKYIPYNTGVNRIWGISQLDWYTVNGLYTYASGTSTGAPTSDIYGVTWDGITPNQGAYNSYGTTIPGQYNPTERTNNSFTVSPNTTNRSELIYLGAKGLTHTTQSLSASYVRAGAIRTAITLVSQTPNGSWTSGGFCEIDSTNMPGIYRIDVPNAVFVAGAESAMLQLTGLNTSNGAVVHYNMAKVQFDLSQNVPLVNTAHSIGDALNAARAQGFGKWQIVGNTMNIYAEDGITLVKSFNLDSGSYPTQRM